MGAFLRYAFGNHRFGIVDAPRWWAYVVVSARGFLLLGALLVAVIGPVTAWIALAVGGLSGFSLFRALTRITLSDMARPGWRPQHPGRFVALVFVNLLETVTLSAILLASIESITPGRAFNPLLDSLGRAWLTASAPVGTSGSTAVAATAEAGLIGATALVLFMLVVVVAAAVNGYTAARTGTPRDP